MATNPGQELASLDFGNLIGGPLVAIITAQSLAARATADFIKTVGFNEKNQPIYVDFTYPKETSPYQPPVPGSVRITNGGSGYTTSATTTVLIGGTAVPGAAAQTDGDKVTGITGIPDATSATTAITVTGGGTVATASWTPPVEAVFPVYTIMKFSVPILTMLPIPFIKIDSATLDFNAKIASIETASESSDLAISGSLEVRQRWGSGAAKLNVSCAYQKKTSSGSSVERTYSMQVHVAASQDEMPAGMEKLLSILEGAMKSVPA